MSKAGWDRRRYGGVNEVIVSNEAESELRRGLEETMSATTTPNHRRRFRFGAFGVERDREKKEMRRTREREKERDTPVSVFANRPLATRAPEGRAK